MKTKRENPLKVLFSFSGEARGKMTGSVILAFIGEMFGMAPYFVVTLLAKELYEGTATVERAAVMAVTAAVCMCLRAWLTGLSSMRSHTVSFTILKNIRCALADKMAKVPMGVMLETPSFPPTWPDRFSVSSWCSFWTGGWGWPPSLPSP